VVGFASMSDVAERFLVYSPEIFHLMAARLVRSIGWHDTHVNPAMLFIRLPSVWHEASHALSQGGAFFRMHVSLFACIMGDDFHGNKRWILETKKHVICMSRAIDHVSAAPR